MSGGPGRVAPDEPIPAGPAGDAAVELVRAAGGLVWRPVGSGVLEVVVVHRDRYDDWSFPKGKAEPGESDEETAVREVLEETGLLCQLGPELGTTRYVDRRGRPKQVRYWAMRVVADVAVRVGDEVDELRWVHPGGAAALLSYARDRDLLAALEAGVGRV